MTASSSPRGWPILVAGALGLALVVGLGIIGGLPRPIEGVFVAGPTLDEGRIVNAIALQDGRVLVASEVDEEPDSRPRTLLLQPRSGTFTPTADTPTSLALQSMASLLDGRVFFLGGSTSDPSRTHARVYDPSADRFDTTGDTASRTWPFLVTLQNGRVLVGGGQVEDDAGEAATVLYDPVSGGFEPTGSMTRARGVGATATLLDDGRVLVVGGGPDVGSSAEVYDPETGTFTEIGSMTVARGGFHTATRLPDGRVLIAGGLVPDPINPEEGEPDVTATAEVFDPATNIFTAIGSMAVARFGHATVVLPNGMSLVVGGSPDPWSEEPLALTDAEVFDAAAAGFGPTSSLLRARLLPVAVPADGRVLIVGHLDPTGEDVVTGASTEWYQ